MTVLSAPTVRTQGGAWTSVLPPAALSAAYAPAHSLLQTEDKEADSKAENKAEGKAQGKAESKVESKAEGKAEGKAAMNTSLGDVVHAMETKLGLPPLTALPPAFAATLRDYQVAQK